MQYLPLTLSPRVPTDNESAAVFARLVAQTMGARRSRTARRAGRRSVTVARRAARA